jgi:hypothetical protein
MLGAAGECLCVCVCGWIGLGFGESVHKAKGGQPESSDGRALRLWLVGRAVPNNTQTHTRGPQ